MRIIAAFRDVTLHLTAISLSYFSLHDFLNSSHFPHSLFFSSRAFSRFSFTRGSSSHLHWSELRPRILPVTPSSSPPGKFLFVAPPYLPAVKQHTPSVRPPPRAPSKILWGNGRWGAPSPCGVSPSLRGREEFRNTTKASWYGSKLAAQLQAYLES